MHTQPGMMRHVHTLWLFTRLVSTRTTHIVAPEVIP